MVAFHDFYFCCQMKGLFSDALVGWLACCYYLFDEMDSYVTLHGLGRVLQANYDFEREFCEKRNWFVNILNNSNGFDSFILGGAA